jgi:hypothetical protein
MKVVVAEVLVLAVMEAVTVVVAAIVVVWVS